MTKQELFAVTIAGIVVALNSPGYLLMASIIGMTMECIKELAKQPKWTERIETEPVKEISHE